MLKRQPCLVDSNIDDIYLRRRPAASAVAALNTVGICCEVVEPNCYLSLCTERWRLHDIDRTTLVCRDSETVTGTAGIPR